MIARNSVFRSLAFVALMSLFSVSAQALTVSVSGGLPGTEYLQSNFNPGGWVSANNNNIGIGSPVMVFSSQYPTVGLTIDQDAFVTFTYLGTEASYKNLSFSGATLLFNNKNFAPGATSGTFEVSAGLVPFSFKSEGAGNVSAINGGSIHQNLLLAFATVPGSPLVVYAFLEDIAKGGDGDLDDMVIRMDFTAKAETTSPVPLPAAVWLFGTGAAGVLLMRRRRRNLSSLKHLNIGRA